MALLYTHKIPHPANFSFARRAAWQVEDLGADVFRLREQTARRWKNPSQMGLARRLNGASQHRVEITARGALRVEDPRGRVVLAGEAGATFGRSGEAWMLQLRHQGSDRFYGLGEHAGSLEKTGQRVKFWNTDLIGDYYFDQIRHEHPNPMYVAVPWLVVQRGGVFLGVFVHHPGEVFMDLASNFVWAHGNRSDRQRRSFYVGAPDGAGDVYLVVGPDLRSLTRKFQALVGRSPLPPLWSLGYHQCRWGYGGPRDLRWLDREMRARGIPCSGLWLDIDYMEDYKVFTFSRKLWGDAARVRRELAALKARGRRVVPILDPGVKVERGYEVCEDGLRRGVFCQNKEGRPFVGFVWPGQTYLPDFSRAATRAWWARRVEALARLGVSAAWIDMNDPAVGAVELGDMLFDRGRQPHASYHNQYALGMAEATRAGFLAARPDERPFLLSRSACAGSGRSTAVWTGDNISNWHHLRMSIPVLLGLSLSGLPFAGADVGGFADNSTRALLIAWNKAAFLLPFFRNHNGNAKEVRAQEPWVFGRSAERIIARYVRLRYKLLPYLYQLFVGHERDGDPIMRPLMYEFPGEGRDRQRMEDEFMIGAALLQAPVVREGERTRPVRLPAGARWCSLQDGRWLPGGRTLTVSAGEAATPLFAREGTIVPMRAGQGAETETDLRTVELHVFLAPGSRREAVLDYVADDGLSFGYRRGERTQIRFTAKWEGRGRLAVEARELRRGFGALRVRVVAYAPADTVALKTAARCREGALRAQRWTATGGPLAVRASGWFEV